MTETAANRLKKLRVRSWRRGIKEMDLVLGPFADKALAGLTDLDLDGYEHLLSENDQDLYAWFSGRNPEPREHAAMLGRIRAHHGL